MLTPQIVDSSDYIISLQSQISPDPDTIITTAVTNQKTSMKNRTAETPHMSFPRHFSSIPTQDEQNCTSHDRYLTNFTMYYIRLEHYTIRKIAESLQLQNPYNLLTSSQFITHQIKSDQIYPFFRHVR